MEVKRERKQRKIGVSRQKISSGNLEMKEMDIVADEIIGVK